MDNMFKYKSMNMAFELDIAGEFIYRGIREFNSLKYISNDLKVFMILYNISVGIERLQKIICVLWTMDQFEDKTKFEKSLITHSHTGLHKRIADAIKDVDCVEYIKFDSRENGFLTLLTEFYNSCRYMRYNTTESEREYAKLCKYIKMYNNNVEYSLTNNIIVSKEIKKFWGRIIGKIVRNYYELIKAGSRNNHVYAYELNADSCAQKVLLRLEEKPNCSTMLEDEKTALREFLVYFRNTSEKASFFKFIDNIKPLSFDPAFANYYIEAICEGTIPQEMVDETETLYEDITEVHSRIDEVNCIGNSSCDFAYGNMDQCLELLRKIIKSPDSIATDLAELAELVVYTDDEEFENRVLCIKEEFDEQNGQTKKSDTIIAKLTELNNEYTFTEEKDSE